MRRWKWLLGGALLLALCIPGGGWLRQRFVRAEAERLMSVCRAANQVRDWQALENSARQLTIREPDNPDGWLYLAEAQNQTLQFQLARDTLHQIPGKSAKVFAALEFATIIELEQLQDPRLAEQTLERMLEIDPQHAESWRKLIYIQAMMLRRSELLGTIRRAIEAQSEPPEAYVYLMISDHLSFTNGYQINQRWANTHPDDEELIIARDLQFIDNSANALNVEQQAEVVKLKRAELLSNLQKKHLVNSTVLAYSLRQAAFSGDVDLVTELLAKVPESASENSLFWRYRGWYHLQQNDLEQAEQAYRQSLKLHSLDWHAWHELAETLRRQGQLDAAAPLAARAVRGKEIRQAMMQLPNAAEVPDTLMRVFENYAADCGDEQVVNALRSRRGVIAPSPATPVPTPPARPGSVPGDF